MSDAKGAVAKVDGASEVAKVSSSMSRGVGVTVAVVVVLITAMAFLYVRLTERERRNVLSARESSAIALADLFAENAQAPLEFRDDESARKAAESLRSNASVLASAVYSAKGTVPFAAYTQPSAAIPPAQAAGSVTWIPAADPVVLRVARAVAATASVPIMTDRVRWRIFQFFLSCVGVRPALVAGVDGHKMTRPAR